MRKRILTMSVILLLTVSMSACANSAKKEESNEGGTEQEVTQENNTDESVSDTGETTGQPESTTENKTEKPDEKETEEQPTTTEKPSEDKADDERKNQLVTAAIPVVKAYADKNFGGMYDFMVAMFTDCNDDGVAELMVAESSAYGDLPGEMYQYKDGAYILCANVKNALADYYKDNAGNIYMIQYCCLGFGDNGEYEEGVWLTNVSSNTTSQLCSNSDEESFYDGKGVSIDEASYNKIIEDAITGLTKIAVKNAYNNMSEDNLESELKAIYEEYMK